MEKSGINQINYQRYKYIQMPNFKNGNLSSNNHNINYHLYNY